MPWEPLNLAAPEYAVPPEPPALLGLIYAGKRHLISGAPESLKTMFAYIAALEHMRAGGKVAIVDLEMGPHAAHTLLAELGATKKEIASTYYIETDEAPTPANLEAMVSAGVTLAIVDAAAGAYAVSGLDDNLRKDAEKFARIWIDPLWKRSVTTLTIDHVTKDAEARGKFAIGSERKVGGADVHLGLQVVRHLHRGGTGLVRIAVHKDRPGFLTRPAAAELELTSEAHTHALSWSFRPATGEEGDGFRPTWYMDAVLEFLARQDEPVSQRTIEAGVGRKAEMVRLAIDKLHDEQRIVIERGPRNAKRVSMVTASDRVPDAETHSNSEGTRDRVPPTTRTQSFGTQSTSGEDDGIPF